MRCLCETTCLVCLTLASKFSEVKNISYKNAVEIMGNKMNVVQVQEYEKTVLDMIQWRLYTLTAHSFEGLLYTETGFEPDDSFRFMMKPTLADLSTLYEFQHKNQCVVAAVAILSVLRRQGVAEERYGTYFELLRVACGLSLDEADSLNRDVEYAVHLRERQ